METQCIILCEKYVTEAWLDVQKQRVRLTGLVGYAY